MLPIRTILHPTDFSPVAYHAFEVACGLARDYQARLVLLHVREAAVARGELGTSDLPGQKESLLRDLHELKPPPEIVAEHRLEEGPVAEAILRVAKDIQCDAIVLATQGRTGLRRAILGSVAESVLRDAPCLVLTVRAGTRTQTPAESTRKPT